MFSSEKSQSSSWHDDQLQIASTFAQHGFCLHAKKCVSSGINGRVDLVSEMLAASTNAASLGKLMNQNDKLVKSLGNKKLQSGVSSKRKRVARNYLSNSALSLPSEDISLLDQYSCYQKHSSETNTES